VYYTYYYLRAKCTQNKYQKQTPFIYTTITKKDPPSHKHNTNFYKNVYNDSDSSDEESMQVQETH